MGLPDSPKKASRNSHSSASSSTIPSPRSEPDLRSENIHRSLIPNGLSPLKHSSQPNPLQSLTSVSSQASLSDINIPASPESHEDNLVPSVFTWNFGGHHVYIAGAWDHWQKKTPMDKCANEHIALIYIPCGEYQFKYYVDDNWRCAPNLPTRTDANGNTNNIVSIAPAHLEFDSPTPIDSSAPPSPLATYDQASTAEYSADPPLLPPHLEARALKPLPDDISPSVAAVNLNPTPPRTPQTPRPALPGIPPTGPPDRSERPFFSHVFIDHLYKAQSIMDDEEIQCLSQTSRIHGKVVSTVFVTRRGPHAHHSNGNGFPHRTPI